MRSPGLIGRAELIAEVTTALPEVNVLLHGPAGVGRSVVLDAVEAGLTEGWRVLRISPTEPEIAVPYLGVAELIDSLPAEAVASVAEPQRLAMERAVARRRAEAPVDPLAVRLGVLAALRDLAVRCPVLIMLDDAQWLDAESHQVLGFVIRRITTERVRVLVAERVEEAQPILAGGLCGPDARIIDVPPLGARDITEILRDRVGADAISQQTAIGIHELSGGNPFFAVEIGKAVARGNPPSPGGLLPIPTTLRAVVSARLSALSRRARQTLQFASALRAPTSTLLLRGGRDQSIADLAEASWLGFARLEGDGTLRFTHPLLPAVLYAETDPTERAHIHAGWAELVADPVERARHRAGAALGADEALAVTLLAAAETAEERGVPGQAAELAVLAVRHTPVNQSGDIVRRRLRAAGYAMRAGRHELVRALGRAVVADPEATRAHRVAAYNLLLDAAGYSPSAAEFGRAALALASGSPELESSIRQRLALYESFRGRFSEAVEQARRASEIAVDDRARSSALVSLALYQSAIGDRAALNSLRTALALNVALESTNLPLWARSRFAFFDDELDDAASMAMELIELAERRGEVSGIGYLGWGLVEPLVNAGQCRLALERSARGLHAAGEIFGNISPALYAAALAEVTGGSVAEALRLARRGMAICRRDGSLPFLARQLWIVGLARLVGGDPEGAVEPLSEVRELELSMGMVDPAVLRYHADLAEALIAAGELDRAQAVISQAREAAVAFDRRGVAAAVTRAEGLLQLARGHGAQALDTLRESITVFDELRQPIGKARGIVALGVAHRRARRRGAARDCLAHAHRIFTEYGAAPWAARVRDELDRGGDSGPASDGDLPELTALEQRICQLVGRGATNREVSGRLNVSVKTIEGALTRIYRKFGVRSRTELAAKLPGATFAPPMGGR